MCVKGGKAGRVSFMKVGRGRGVCVRIYQRVPRGSSHRLRGLLRVESGRPGCVMTVSSVTNNGYRNIGCVRVTSFLLGGG